MDLLLSASDLAGVTYLRLQDGDNFNGRNRGTLEPQLRRWLASTTPAGGTTKPNLPKLYEAILQVVGEFKPDSSGAEGVLRCRPPGDATIGQGCSGDLVRAHALVGAG